MYTELRKCCRCLPLYPTRLQIAEPLCEEKGDFPTIISIIPVPGAWKRGEAGEWRGDAPLTRARRGTP